MALNLADEIDISPWDALLVAVKRRAARVRSCDVIAEKIMEKHRQECADDPDYAATHDPEVPPATVRTWLAESRNEERIMVRTAKMAVDAGVADAMIRRMEREGQLLTESLVAALDSIELDPDQRMAAFAALHKYIAQTPILQSDNHKIIEGRPQEDQ